MLYPLVTHPLLDLFRCVCVDSVLVDLLPTLLQSLLLGLVIKGKFDLLRVDIGRPSTDQVFTSSDDFMRIVLRWLILRLLAQACFPSATFCLSSAPTIGAFGSSEPVRGLSLACNPYVLSCHGRIVRTKKLLIVVLTKSFVVGHSPLVPDRLRHISRQLLPLLLSSLTVESRLL